MVAVDNTAFRCGKSTPNNNEDSSTTENLFLGCKSTNSSSSFLLGLWKFLEPLPGSIIRPTGKLIETTESYSTETAGPHCWHLQLGRVGDGSSSENQWVGKLVYHRLWHRGCSCFVRCLARNPTCCLLGNRFPCRLPQQLPWCIVS